MQKFKNLLPIWENQKKYFKKFMKITAKLYLVCNIKF